MSLFGRFSSLVIFAGLGASASAFAAAAPELPANGVSGSSLQAERTLYSYSQENLVADLTQQLSERYRVSGDLQVELLRAWTPQRPTTEPLKLVVLEAPGSLTSNLLVRFRLLAGTQTVVETSIMVRVQLQREVWVARGQIERASVFDPAQFDIRTVDTLRERDAVATSETNTELTFARTVPAGRVVTWRDVSRRALVRKGQVIDVCAVDGALTVSMKALAMENGIAGETVKVRNIQTKKDFNAVVVAESRAEVRL